MRISPRFCVRQKADPRSPGCSTRGTSAQSTTEKVERGSFMELGRGSGQDSKGSRCPQPPGFPAQELAFLGRRPASFLTGRPGRGSKPRSVSGSIRLRALLDGRGNASSRPSGLAPGESAVSPYPGGFSDTTPSPCHRTVSFLLRSSDSRLSGSRPTPCFPERGLSSAPGRCRHGPPSAALHLLAPERPVEEGKSLRWHPPVLP